jgi:hypothetical protein
MGAKLNGLLGDGEPLGVGALREEVMSKGRGLEGRLMDSKLNGLLGDGEPLGVGP